MLIFLPAAPYAPRYALFHMFDWHQANFNSFQGWMVCAAFLLNSFSLAICIRLIVQRAKKCLDFSATAYFLHLVTVTTSSGFPAEAVWWLCMAVNLTITTLLSEWLCLQQELKEIPLATIPRRVGSSVQLTSIVTHR